tara:strand:+ start:178 stop:567 length:390 start_codon:yes stop_codon:yes gene_type:complete
MSDLIQNKRSELNNEEFNAFDTIIELMNQKDFRMLFESQFNDFSEIKSVILIMKTYHYIEKLYFEKKGVLPSKEIMKKGIRELMNNANIRRFLVDSTISFIKEDNVFEKIIDENLNKLRYDLLTFDNVE